MDEWDYTECPKCGSDSAKSFVCWSCGGEGGEYPYENLPLEYEPNEFERCDICRGAGHYTVCQECEARKEDGQTL